MVEVAPEIDVRQEILVVATRLFAARGVAGTSLQAIADGVGVAKPTLVYHFGSKDKLREEVLTSLLGHWRDELPRMMMAAAGAGPRVDALLGALFRFFLEDRNRSLLILREVLDHPEFVRELLTRHLQPWTRLLTEAVRVGQASRVIRADLDPEAFTLLMITTALGVLAIGDRASALISPEPSLDAQLDELIRVARAALYIPRPAHAEEA